MQPDFYDKDLHIRILGAPGTGKTALLQSFCNDSVSLENEEGSGTTIFTFETMNIRIRVSKKERWDKDESRDVDAVALVYSTVDADSFDYALDLYREILHTRYFPIVVIENKIDQLEQSVVDKNFAEERLRKSHLRLYRVSAKEDFNVMHPFAYLLEKLTRNCRDENSNERKRSPVEDIRLPSREGWASPRETKKPKKESCVIQ